MSNDSVLDYAVPISSNRTCIETTAEVDQWLIDIAAANWSSCMEVRDGLFMYLHRVDRCRCRGQ